MACAICLGESKSPVYTCECGVRACAPCFKEYVSAYCTSVAKCPGQCVREMSDDEVVSAFGRGGEQQLARLFAARVEAEDAQYVEDARLRLLPLAKRLQELAEKDIPEARKAVVEASAARRGAFRALAATLSACFNRQLTADETRLHTMESQLMADTPTSARAWDSVFVSVLMSKSRLIMEAFSARIAGRAWSTERWADQMWRMVSFVLSAREHCVPRLDCNEDCQYKPFGCKGSCVLGREETRANLAAADVLATDGVDAFLAYIAADVANYRLDKAISLYRAIFDAIDVSPLAVVLSGNPATMPAFAESHEPRWKYFLPPSFVRNEWFDRNSVMVMDTHNRPFPCGTEGCAGAFTTGDPTCHTCHTVFCADCHEVKGVTHICTPGAKETILSIRAETRPCPRCKAAVFHASGCDQMMCVLCHCMFSFTTGKLVVKNSALHNPHYLALDEDARQAVRRGLAERDAAAPTDPNEDLACIEMHDERFGAITRRMILASHSFSDYYRYLTYFRTLSATVSTGRERMSNAESYNRRWRLQYMLGVSLQAGPTYRTVHEFAPVCKPFTHDDYMRRLKASAQHRKARLTELSRLQTMCDTAKELFIAYCRESNGATRASLGKMLDQLVADSKPKTRKRRQPEEAAA